MNFLRTSFKINYIYAKYMFISNVNYIPYENHSWNSYVGIFTFSHACFFLAVAGFFLNSPITYNPISIFKGITLDKSMIMESASFHVWSWLRRWNQIIFKEASIDVDRVFDAARYRAWSWCKVNIKGFVCMPLGPG